MKASFSAPSDNPGSHLDVVSVSVIVRSQSDIILDSVRRIYASMNYVNIDLDNGLSPEQRQASILSRVATSITFQKHLIFI